MDDIYENIDYNRNRKRKILIVFDGMIADIQKFEYLTCVYDTVLFPSSKKM